MDIFNETQGFAHLISLNSTQTEELSSLLNSTNSTIFGNSTIEDNSVPKGLEIASLIFLWILSVIGCFVFYNIQKYLKSKAPGSKTLLDEFYIKLFLYWIFESYYISFLMSLKMIWEAMPLSLVVLLFNANILVIIVPFLHLLFCLLCNMILILKPTINDGIEDKKIVYITL